MFIPSIIPTYKSYKFKNIKIRSYNHLNQNYKLNNRFQDCFCYVFIPDLFQELPVLIKYITSFDFNDKKYNIAYIKIVKKSKLTNKGHFNIMDPRCCFYLENKKYQYISRFINLEDINNKILVFPLSNNKWGLSKKQYF